MQLDHPHSEENEIGRIGDIRLWMRLMAFTALQWQWVTVAILLALVISATGLALPKLVQLAMDQYIVHPGLSPDERLQGLTRLGGLFLGIIWIGFVANFFQVIALEWAGQNIMHAIRRRLFAHTLRLNLAFHDAHPVGRLVTRLTNDIQNMHEMFTSVIVTLFNEAVRLIGILAILAWMNWRLTIILGLTFPLMAVITYWFGRLSRGAFRLIRAHLASINAFLQETVSGISVIQLFLREKDTQVRFDRLNSDYCKASFHQIRIFGVFVPLIEVMNSLAMALIIWYGGGQILQDHMTLGVLTAFLSYMRLFFQPLRELSQKYSIVQSAMASAERIFELLESTDMLPAVEEPVAPQTLRGAVAFQEVTFEYESGRPVLKDISFTVQPGETLAVVGATGSGKTTLLSLIERFYDPREGSIRIDGTDLRRFEVHWLREQIGLVMQDVFIIPGSIRDNILLNRQASEEEIDDLLRLSQLSILVKDLPQGIDTLIGEGGMDLSAGQKQLLAFARVLARNPRILMLDEATANVDTETEMLIERAIQAVLSNRTSIIIAHRLSTIRRVDRILVLDQGQIIEQGTHEALMAAQGAYYQLQTLQEATKNGFSDNEEAKTSR